MSSDARSDRPDHECQDAGKEAEAEQTVFAQARENRGNATRNETAPMSATTPVQRGKTPLRSVTSPPAMRNAAKPMAESKKGPAEAVATARVTMGFAWAPSVVALAIMTIAMAMPAMPVIAPANATRASSAEPPDWSDGIGELVAFCPECARREFAPDAPASGRARRA